MLKSAAVFPIGLSYNVPSLETDKRIPPVRQFSIRQMMLGIMSAHLRAPKQLGRPQAATLSDDLVEAQTMRLPSLRLTYRTTIALLALVVVIAGIIGFLNLRQEIIEREQCRINLRNLALAVCGYERQFGTSPPATYSGGPLPSEQRVSWVPLILTYADWCQDWCYLFDNDRPWNAPENRLPRIRQFPVFSEPPSVVKSTEPPLVPPVLVCPANHCKVERGMPSPMHYVGIAGLGRDAPSLPSGHPRSGVFGYDRKTRMADIKDGASETMMLAETTSANGPWTAGGPATVRGLDPAQPPYLGRARQFGGAHRGGAMMAFADGSVRFLRESIDSPIFEAVATVAGRETIAEGWDR